MLKRFLKICLLIAVLPSPSFSFQANSSTLITNNPKEIIDQVWQIIYRDFLDYSEKYKEEDWIKLRKEILSTKYFNNDDAYVAIKDWRFGLSVPGILNANMEFSNSSENQITSHFYTMISYTKKLNDEWFFYPSLLIKNAEQHQQVDANLNVRFKNRFWFGASYRTSPNEESKIREAFGPSFYVGIDLGRLFTIYSHDISSGNISS